MSGSKHILRSLTINFVKDAVSILTLQAWDADGVMYRIQYNININVPH